MFRHTYETMNEKLEPEEELLELTLERMKGRRESRQGGRGHVRAGRVFAVALTTVLVLTLSLTAVAAAVPEIGRFLQGLLPKYGEYLQPVSPAPESPDSAVPAAMGEISENGIQLQVLAAASDRDNAAVYYTLTDSEGRIDGSTRITGELELGGVTVPFTARPVNYDSQTGTATFCQRVAARNGIDGSEARLTVTALLGDIQQTDVSLNLGDLELQKEPEFLSCSLTPSEDVIARAYDYRYRTLVQDGKMAFLQPREGTQFSPELNNVLLTGAGYTDGRLHLQFRLTEFGSSCLLLNGGVCSDSEFEPDGSKYSTHPFVIPFQLEGGAVSKIHDGVVQSKAEDGSPEFLLGNEYVEIVDTIPEECLKDWTWNFTLLSYRAAVQGRWTQSFTLTSGSDAALELSGPYVVQVGTKYLPEDGADPEAEFPSAYAPSTIDTVRITPFAITVTRAGTAEDETPEIDGILKRFAPDLSKLEITVRTEEETFPYQLDREGYTVVPDEEGNMTARYVTDVPVEPDRILSITVNDVEIPVSEMSQ